MFSWSQPFLNSCSYSYFCPSSASCCSWEGVSEDFHEHQPICQLSVSCQLANVTLPYTLFPSWFFIRQFSSPVPTQRSATSLSGPPSTMWGSELRSKAKAALPHEPGGGVRGCVVTLTLNPPLLPVSYCKPPPMERYPHSCQTASPFRAFEGRLFRKGNTSLYSHKQGLQ